MWLLKNLTGDTFFLVSNKRYTVGRKDTDLVLVDDQSISRKHAVILPELGSMEPGTLDNKWMLIVHDLKSKYGTFIKVDEAWTPLSPNVDHQLFASQLNQVTIRFGLLANEWTLLREPIIATTSNMSRDLRSVLKESLKVLDGTVVSTWKAECTHLTMSKITLTVKAVCAMACGRPIVTPEYWKKCLETVNSSVLSHLPDCRDYLPPLAETTINKATVSFHVDQNRKNLFQGKCFVFASMEKLKEQGSMVTFAGGKAVEYETCGLTLEQLSEPHIRVVSYFCNESQESQSLMPFFQLLKQLTQVGRRSIPDSEIGLAILHCSVDKYCNPEYNISSSYLLNSNLTQTRLDMSSQILASQSQDTQSSSIPSNVVIPASGSSTKTVNNETFDFFLTNPSGVVKPSNECNRSSEMEDDLKKMTNQTNPRPIKRAGGRDLEGEPVFKKPTTSTIFNTVVNISDQEDFEFPSDSRSTRKQSLNEDDNPFDFPIKTSRSRPVRSREACDEDLFGTSSASVVIDDDVDMFATDDPQVTAAVDSSSTPLTSGPGKTLSKKRKMEQEKGESKRVRRERVKESKIEWREKLTESENEQKEEMKESRRELREELKEETRREAMSVNTTVDSKASVSLVDFVDTSNIKKEEDAAMDNLADDVVDLVLIQDKPLLAKKPKPAPLTTAVSCDESITGARNFKLFRKVAQHTNRILPRIIGGKDLVEAISGAVDNWDKTMNHVEDADNPSEGELEADVWDFPEAKKDRKKAKPRGR